MPSARTKAGRRRKDKKSAAAPDVKAQTFKQRDERAGLLVTEEFEKAVAECKAQVERISKVTISYYLISFARVLFTQCTREGMSRQKSQVQVNLLFPLSFVLVLHIRTRDNEFDLEHNQYFVLMSDFRRSLSALQDPKFFRDKNAKAGDIHQGALGDCWFLSALATISAMEGLVEKLCVARDEQVGVYGFIFFRETHWVPVIIDEALSWRKEQYEAIARRGGGGLYFAKCSGGDETSRETWVPIIEKAFAKLHGDYASLDGGFSCEALEDLTGGISHVIQVEDILDPDLFWTEELLKVNKDRLFGCGLRFDSSWRNGWASATENGLVGSHAYSILKAVEVAGKRFLIIRNPWGAPNSEWTGRWSDGDEAWTNEWLARLPEIGHTFSRSDGQFVMEYSDFLANWEDIDRTLLLDSTWVMSSQMLRVDCRPLPSASTWGDVSFTVDIPESSPTILVLSKMDERYFTGLGGRSYWHFAFTVFKKGQSEPVTDSVGMAFRGALRSDHVELDLEKGTYVVHVKIGRIYKDEPTWYSEGRKKWPPHKLSEVLAERARSRAMAANFKVEEEYNNLHVPRSVIGGVTLEELTLKAKEADIAKAAADKAAAEAEGEWVDEDEEDKDASTTTPADAVPDTAEADGEGAGSGEDEDGDDDDSSDSDFEPPASAEETFGSDELDLIPENNQVYLTLRAYTKKGASAVITGHLREGASFKNLGLQENWWVKAKS
ncbi:hypothetical protein DL96DRAFT_1729686 [Flagelloscypha sp. PMI_526]|nr:hypothetical protein DL96DRAFT_1729686 [Flagelloscypha sp. PMI_526]